MKFEALAAIQTIFGRGLVDNEKIPYGIYKHIEPSIDRLYGWMGTIDDLELDKPWTYGKVTLDLLQQFSQRSEGTNEDPEHLLRGALLDWGYKRALSFDVYTGGFYDRVLDAGEFEYRKVGDSNLQHVSFPDWLDGEFHFFTIESLEDGSRTQFIPEDLEEKIEESDEIQGTKFNDAVAEIFWSQIDDDQFVFMDTMEEAREAHDIDAIMPIVMPVEFGEKQTRGFVGKARNYLDRWERYTEQKQDAHTVLLHGPPGTGKTTLAWEAAREITNRILCMPLNAMLDDHFRLTRELETISPDAVVMNDIDRASEEAKLELLGSLDSLIDSVDLIMMTSNHLDRLPQAVRRPGRIDQIIEITNEDTYPEELARMLVEEHDLDLTSQQISKLADLIDTHSGAHAEELAFRMHVLEEGEDPVLDSDRTYDDNWLENQSTKMEDIDGN